MHTHSSMMIMFHLSSSWGEAPGHRVYHPCPGSRAGVIMIMFDNDTRKFGWLLDFLKTLCVSGWSTLFGKSTKKSSEFVGVGFPCRDMIFDLWWIWIWNEVWSVRKTSLCWVSGGKVQNAMTIFHQIMAVQFHGSRASLGWCLPCMSTSLQTDRAASGRPRCGSHCHMLCPWRCFFMVNVSVHVIMN